MARDLVNALIDLLNVQNDFLSVWVDHEVQRLNLDFDLGTMELDGNGIAHRARPAAQNVLDESAGHRAVRRCRMRAAMAAMRGPGSPGDGRAAAAAAVLDGAGHVDAPETGPTMAPPIPFSPDSRVGTGGIAAADLRRMASAAESLPPIR